MLLLVSLVLGACGSDDDDSGGDDSASTAEEAPRGRIQKNPDNSSTTITVGSKNFTEQKLLGEIYAQALDGRRLHGREAAQPRRRADRVQGDRDRARSTPIPSTRARRCCRSSASRPTSCRPTRSRPSSEAKAGYAEKGMTALRPDAVHELERGGRDARRRPRSMGLEKISDLEGKSQDLTLYGTPECRQRLDCLLGLQEVYGLKFKKFVPVAIALRHEVLSKGQADVSIVFTTDPQITAREASCCSRTTSGMFPPYNSTFVVRDDVVEKAGPDLPEGRWPGRRGPDRRGDAGAERPRRPRQEDAGGGGRRVPVGVGPRPVEPGGRGARPRRGGGTRTLRDAGRSSRCASRTARCWCSTSARCPPRSSGCAARPRRRWPTASARWRCAAPPRSASPPPTAWRWPDDGPAPPRPSCCARRGRPR